MMNLKSIPILAEYAFLTIAASVTIYSIILGTFFIDYPVMSATVVGSSLGVYITIRSLRIRGVGPERIFVGLASAASGLWLYEACYHYAWIFAGRTEALYAIPRNLLTLNINTGESSFFPLPWAIIMILLPAVAYRHIRMGRMSMTVLGLSVLTFFLWISAGYPQFFDGEFMGTVYNSVTKFLVYILPASLFVGSGKHPPAYVVGPPILGER
jgi:hypothetical protein